MRQRLVLVLAKSADTQTKEDCCNAAEILMLAGRAEGFGICWIGLARRWLNLPSSKRELGLPEQCHIVAPVTLGHPKAWPESHGRNPVEINWLWGESQCVSNASLIVLRERQLPEQGIHLIAQRLLRLCYRMN